MHTSSDGDTNDTIRIDADLLIPGRGEPIEHGTVVMDGGRITYVGPTSGAPAADTTVEVPAVLPGMWEAHAHFLGMTEGDVHALLRTPMPLLAARAAEDAKLTLMGGVTSAREVGGYGIDLASGFADGSLVGPTIYGAGSILSTTGGHADGHAFPLDFIEASPAWLGEICDGVPASLRAVRKQLRKGARVIKICASGGVMSEIDHPIHQQFSEDELAAIVAEAGRAERIVAAHCHGKPGIMAALRSGVKTIEHGSYLDEEAAELMVANDAVLVPTRFVVDELLKMEAFLPAYAYRKGVMVSEHHEMAMKIAISAGVKIATGTDIFVSGAGFYGRNSLEVKHLVDAGMTPLEAIEAATANGPLTVGPQAPQSGQLAEGYDADVIAMDANPIDDLSVWGDPVRVTHVWKSGRTVKGPA